MERSEQTVPGQPWPAFKFIVFSLIGIVAFFVPFTIGQTRSIPIDLISRSLLGAQPTGIAIYALALMLLGAVLPFVNQAWKESRFEAVYTLIKIAGFVAGVLIMLNTGPEWLLEEHIGKFLFFELVLSISLIVPISAVFLQFLMGYGLMEFLGVLFQRIMRPIWKVPGRSAIHAITSRFASLIVIYLMVSNDYKHNKLSQREAVIIATGFVAVEIPFIIIMARTLDIMEYFPMFFLVAMITTYLVTAILVRFWPLSRVPDTYHDPDQAMPEDTVESQMMRSAYSQAIEVSSRAPSLAAGILDQLKGAFLMATSVLPAILAIGIACMLIAERTPIFDYLAYIFYPITMLLQAPEPMLTAKAVSLGITEILLPALIVVEASLATKFIVGVVSISGILFFSTSIPSVLSSSIPLSVGKMVLIWFMRTIISLFIAIPVTLVLF